MPRHGAWPALLAALLCRVVLAAISPFSRGWENTVAICAIAKREKTEDVREWLQYHRCVSSRFQPLLDTQPTLKGVPEPSRHMKMM